MPFPAAAHTSSSCAKRGPIRISDGPLKAEDAFLMRHACSIRVFNVRLEPCLRRTSERVVPNGQASHRFRWTGVYCFSPLASRPMPQIMGFGVFGRAHV